MIDQAVAAFEALAQCPAATAIDRAKQSLLCVLFLDVTDAVAKVPEPLPWEAREAAEARTMPIRRSCMLSDRRFGALEPHFWLARLYTDTGQ